MHLSVGIIAIGYLILYPASINVYNMPHYTVHIVSIPCISTVSYKFAWILQTILRTPRLL